VYALVANLTFTGLVYSVFLVFRLDVVYHRDFEYMGGSWGGGSPVGEIKSNFVPLKHKVYMVVRVREV
jgi:hypothetical protein